MFPEMFRKYTINVQHKLSRKIKQKINRKDLGLNLEVLKSCE